VQSKPAFICHCCGCCCGALRSINEHGVAAVQPSNFIAVIDTGKCCACGVCTDRCHIGGLTLAGDTAKPAVETSRCLGCGVCVRACPQGAITLARRRTIHIPPKDKTDQMMRIARERGKI